jgi:hypothetical protein
VIGLSRQKLNEKRLQFGRKQGSTSSGATSLFRPIILLQNDFRPHDEVG